MEECLAQYIAFVIQLKQELKKKETGEKRNATGEAHWTEFPASRESCISGYGFVAFPDLTMSGIMFILAVTK